MKRQKWWAIISLFVVAGIWVGGRYISPGDSYAIVLETQTQTIELEVTPRVEKSHIFRWATGGNDSGNKGRKEYGLAPLLARTKLALKWEKIPDNGGFIACLLTG